MSSCLNCSPSTIHSLLTASYKHANQTIKRRSPCSSLPPFSLSLPALPSPWPRPTLPFAAAELHNAASSTFLILLPSPARTVSAGFALHTFNSLTTVPATGAPQTIAEFDAVCAGLGVTAQCCVLPIVSPLTFDNPSVTNANTIAARPGPSLRFPVKNESACGFAVRGTCGSDQSIMLHLARMNLVDWTRGLTVGIDDYVGCEAM